MKIRKWKIKDLKISSSIQEDYYDTMREGKSHDSYEYWNYLTESLKEGYNPKDNCYIRLSKKGHMLDGNHRAVVLKDMYGGEKEIDVKVVSIPYHILLVIMFLFIVAPIDYIISLFTGKKECNDCIPVPRPKLERGILKWKGKEYSILSSIWSIIKTILLIPIALLVFIISKIGSLLGIENKKVKAYKKIKGLK